MTNLGEVLTTARRACGYTQEDLAGAAGVTQAALSRYENDLREPEAEVLERLARVLGVTAAFLTRAGRVHGGMAVDAHMRRRQTARPTTWRRLEARLNMYRMHASFMYEEISVRAEQYIPRLDPLDTPPADAARMVRMQWRMPIGPVRSLVRWLEAAGVLVIDEDFGTPRVDGMSQWIGDHPIILLNSRAPTDRRRLTLAHELGHLVLHSVDVSAYVEDEADAFAAEFLMPIEVIRPQLRTLKMGYLHDLKREWGVSMQALVERAYRAELMTPLARTNMYKAFSARGWRTAEPLGGELPPETPSLAATIGATLTGKGMDPGDIAHIAGFAGPEHNTLFAAPPPLGRLTAVRGV
ncbi:helix-turn-helix domain-containing protein [Herbidospora mongoliensis]|uniref:helix-turn-helix domain-containing protein n=1 Tax=Herbidospora mongoliensis TaxID=688067 RepID=UPI00082F7FD0|nr:XRE family transcriptional regulator [Herbidospora mongoliensis]